MALGWQFRLARAFDLDELGTMRQVHDRTITVDLNKSGSAGGWLSTSDEVASLIWPWSTAVIVEYTDPEDHELITLWSGPVNSRQTDMSQGRVSFTAVGWFERLMKLNLQERVEYVDMDAGAIITDLLSKAFDLDARIQVTIGTVEVTQLRSATYEVDQSIGQAILELCNLESGFDWYIHPITRQLNIVSRLGMTREEAVWSFLADETADGIALAGRGQFKLSEHSNLENLVENVDGDIANDIRPRGKFSSGLATDVESQASYGVFMDATALSDVTENTILNAYANAEIVYRSQPRVIYTLTPKPSSHPRALRLFRDFDIGDTTYITARRDFIDIAGQPTRIFGATLAIDDFGVETISNLQTTAS